MPMKNKEIKLFDEAISEYAIDGIDMDLVHAVNKKLNEYCQKLEEGVKMILGPYDWFKHVEFLDEPYEDVALHMHVFNRGYEIILIDCCFHVFDDLGCLGNTEEKLKRIFVADLKYNNNEGISISEADDISMWKRCIEINYQ